MNILSIQDVQTDKKTVGCFTPFIILANNFLPLNVALAILVIINMGKKS
jgi:hypothetical protein